MPPIYTISCDKCDFRLERFSSAVMYVLDGESNEVVCPHPGEPRIIAKTLGLPEKEVYKMFTGKESSMDKDVLNKIKKNTFYRTKYVCVNCFEGNYFDSNRDEMRCPSCGGTNLKEIGKLLKEKTCPKCGEGTVTDKVVAIS